MKGVVLVLAHASDAGAASVAASVRAMLSEGAAAVEVWNVLPESLCQAVWSRTVDTYGRPHICVALPGRPVLGNRQILAVFNRVQQLPVAGLGLVGGLDYGYAAAEFQGLVLGWLAACGDRVLHPLQAPGLLVPQLSVSLWQALAQDVGLPVATPDASAPVQTWDATVLVAGTYTTGVLARRYGRACTAAAQALGYSLLEFRFSRGPSEMVLVAVDTHPTLSDLEDIDGVAACLLDMVYRESAKLCLH